MTHVLGDGSVIPSVLGMHEMGGAREMIRSNAALRVGAVSKIYYPDDPDSVSKKTIEYDVVVTHGDPINGLNIITYRHCRLNNLFGASNNRWNMTYQPGQQNTDGTIMQSSNVLVLCIDGISDAGSAIIIGGVDDKEGPIFKRELGQFWDYMFNGINWNINKDGEWSLTFNSVIDANGKKANEKAAGTQIKMDKDGRLKISDNEGQSWEIDRAGKKSTWTNGSESIVIDKTQKSISLESAGDTNIKAGKKLSTSSKDNTSMESSKDISMKAGSDMKMEASSNLNMKSGGNWEVKVGGNAQVSAGGNLLMKGGANAQIKGIITMVGDGSVPAAGVGISICLGIGNLAAPVISTVMTGSATVLIGT